MKWLILAAVLVAGPAVAEPTPREQVCAMQAKVSRGIMERRQAGYPVEDAMAWAAEAPGGLEDWYRERVLAAYATQRWNSPTMRVRATEDFGTETYMRCIGGDA